VATTVEEIKLPLEALEADLEELIADMPC